MPRSVANLVSMYELVGHQLGVPGDLAGIGTISFWGEVEYGSEGCMEYVVLCGCMVNLEGKE